MCAEIPTGSENCLKSESVLILKAYVVQEKMSGLYFRKELLELTVVFESDGRVFEDESMVHDNVSNENN